MRGPVQGGRGTAGELPQRGVHWGFPRGCSRECSWGCDIYLSCAVCIAQCVSVCVLLFFGVFRYAVQFSIPGAVLYVELFFLRKVIAVYDVCYELKMLRRAYKVDIAEEGRCVRWRSLEYVWLCR